MRGLLPEMVHCETRARRLRRVKGTGDLAGDLNLGRSGDLNLGRSGDLNLGRSGDLNLGRSGGDLG
ncbi:hypothetical protein [Sorangium sp. So ce124]|uniref:hypothetical protein n=1 Tax=Sorangium sp. So ce124 TaxID=3133280 RepID=UPI003F5E136F